MSRNAIIEITPFKCQNLQMSLTHLCASSYRFADINILFFLPPNSRSRSRSAIYEITPFDGKCQNQQILTHIFTLALTISRYMNFFNIYLQSRSRSRSTITASLSPVIGCWSSRPSSHNFPTFKMLVHIACCIENDLYNSLSYHLPYLFNILIFQ